MKTLVIYDSIYGNTETIAKTITSAIPGAKITRASAITPSGLAPFDFIIAGSPVHGGQPSPALKALLDSLTPESLKGKKCATFDTRMVEKEQNFAVRLLLKTIKYAAEKTGGLLTQKGGTVVATEGFFVHAKKGPLKPGEIERAATWAKAFK